MTLFFHNNRAEADSFLTSNLAYIILFVVFFSASLYYVTGYQDGIHAYEDFYAKQFAGIVDASSPGQTVSLDISRLVALAYKNKQSLDSLIIFDNEAHSVSVRITPSSGATFSYFNDVIISDKTIEILTDGKNAVLHFSIKEARDVT